MIPAVGLIAMAAALVAHQFIPWLWYRPLFGRIWRLGRGVPADEPADSGDRQHLRVVYPEARVLVVAAILTMGPHRDLLAGIAVGALVGVAIGAAVVGTGVFEGRDWRMSTVVAAYGIAALLVVGAIPGGMSPPTGLPA